MTQALDLSSIYNLRSNFVVIGITGRTGSGCSEVASLLSKGFDANLFPAPETFPLMHNSYRKYRILYKYAKENFKPFTLLEYKDIISLFILKYGYFSFVSFLVSRELDMEFGLSKLELRGVVDEIAALSLIQNEFENLNTKVANIDFDDRFDGQNKLFDIYSSEEFISFNEKFHKALCINSKVKRNKILGVISSNLRKTGSPYHNGETCPDCIFTIARVINKLIKGIRKKNNTTQVVVDSLRNPLEIMFFKQRFASFYLMSVNAEDKVRNTNLQLKYGPETGFAKRLFDEEYNGSKAHEFFKQNVADCIQSADIHVSYLSDVEMDELNKNNLSENKSPYFSWRMQMLKYVCLILQPGIVTPSPEERCMQIALTAKYNSGCISRQVGAAITDEYYSLKAIGWNNTPEGQVPCNLRNVEDLITQTGDLEAFTPYELNSQEFKEVVISNFKDKISCNQTNLKGRNVCMCFKSLRNSVTEGKNQVHTRSLHAEESAFLQIAKYGGTGIKGGMLFTTASPCELCSKKAYQLGIKVIYYIDPYPGISGQQILSAGQLDRQPKVRLFNGAIGKAYHWLYEPIMSYKDELSLLIGQQTTDLTSVYKSQIERQSNIIDTQAEVIEQLQARLLGFEAN